MIRSLCIAATLLATFIYAQTRDVPVTMGNVAVHYNINSVISTENVPLTAAASGPIWCQATLNEVPLPILNSTFVKYHDHKRRRFMPEINHTSHKASYEVGQTVHESMGKYRCEITIDDGEERTKTVFGNLMVYSPPFFHVNSSMKLKADELNPRIVTGGELYATEGETMVIECPVTGYPKPNITWYKNTEVMNASARIPFVNDTKLFIEQFEESDSGVYRCTATNKFPMKLDTQIEMLEASLEQTVTIGSPYGWLYPLIVILVILLLLFLIIYACAACKRYQHDNYNVAKREKRLLRSPSPTNTSASASSTITKKYELVSNA